MSTYAIYDDASGAVRYFMTSTADHIDASTPPGCAWLEVSAIPDGGWHVDLNTKQLVEGALDLRTLDQALTDVLAGLDASYDLAIIALGNVTFTTGAGDTHTYQAGPDSVVKLSNTIQGNQGTQSVPQGFFWVAADNTQVPFTWADLLGLAAAMFAPGHALFVQLQNLKATARAATTVAAVTAVVWPAATA